ncbi:MAG: hypothetical protein AB7E79_08965 [Rhodospirillaceae bacterium]
MRRNIDGNEERTRGRSNRKTGYDDNSMLGRGHGFGPETSRGMRRPRRDEEMPNRNYGRIADERGSARESRGPETSHYLEDDTYTRGSMSHQGYGSRSRSMEATRGPRSRARDEFDDDLVR